MRIRSVALHEKAAPPALPRGSSLQKEPRAGGLVELGKAVRATERNAGAEKAGTENEAAHTKKPTTIYSSAASKPSTTVGSQSSIASSCTGRSLAVLLLDWPDVVSRPSVTTAGSVTDQPTTRSVSDEEFNAGQRGKSWRT